MNCLHRLILRLAAMIVPVSLRTEWLAEWQSELFHASVEPDMKVTRLTAFCRGAFQDAFWLWLHQMHRPQAGASPLSCLLILAAITGAARISWWFAGPVRNYPVLSLILVVSSSTFLASINLRRIVVRHPEAPRSGITRRWLFFTVKIALILATLHFSLVVAVSLQAWGAIQALIVACTFAFRWALRDQQARCPVCLRLLAQPARVGVASPGFLGWSGVEMMCCQGHGLLYVPESPTDHYHDPRWVDLDPSWGILFPPPDGK
jgi:hypothetical protein